MVKLKPCPFCGGEAELIQREHWSFHERVTGYTPRCKNPSCCGRNAKEWVCKENAISNWNRRASNE